MEQRKKSREERLDMLVNLVWRDPALWRSICTSEWYDAERLELLYQIVAGMAHGRKDGLENRIYQYGSMIKEQDFVARELFIWLLRIKDEIVPAWGE